MVSIHKISEKTNTHLYVVFFTLWLLKFVVDISNKLLYSMLLNWQSSYHSIGIRIGTNGSNRHNMHDKYVLRGLFQFTKLITIKYNRDFIENQGKHK